jgi:hypothetical protein
MARSPKGRETEPRSFTKLSFKIAFWIFCSWKDSGFIVAENLIRRTGAFRCSAFHKALEIDGAVFAGEVAVAGPFTLDTVRAMPASTRRSSRK